MPSSVTSCSQPSEGSSSRRIVISSVSRIG